MRGLTLLAAMALVVVACSDDAPTSASTSTLPSPTTTQAGPATTDEPGNTTTSTDPSSTVIMSDDGYLSLEIPFDAFAGGDPGFSIRKLNPDEFPEVLQSASSNPGVAIYSLEPAGFELQAPATVRRYLDPANFPDLTMGQVPLTGLAYSLDGTEFHQVGSPTVWATDDGFGVLGTVSSLGTVVTLREPANLDFTLTGLSHRDSRTRIGLGLSDFDGLDLGFVPRLSLVSVQDGAEIVDEGEAAWVACKSNLPSFWAEVAWDLDLSSPEEALLRSTEALTGGDYSTEYSVRLNWTYRCASKNLFADLTSSYSFAVDHPGGEEIIDGGDFRGGNSGLKGSGVFANFPQGFQVYMGLIQDVNDNGWVDGSDVVFPPQHVDIGVDGSWDYGDALFNFGNYFVYGVDRNVWDGLGLAPTSLQWSDVVDAVADNPDFTTSAGVFTKYQDEGWLLPIQVSAAEGVTADSEGEQVPFAHEPERILTRFSIDF